MLHLVWIALFIDLPKAGVIDSEEWTVPVFRSVAVHLHNAHFFVFDGAEGMVKAFDVSKDWQDPKHLWSTAGEGQGPGEFPRGTAINNLTTDPGGDELWVSSFHGISIFDAQNGRHLRDIKATYFKSWVLVEDDAVYTTTKNSIFDRTLLRRWDKSTLVGPQSWDESPLWRIEHPTLVPVNKKGEALAEHHEVFRIGDRLMVFNFTLGTLSQISSDGTILSYEEVSSWRWSDDFEVDDYLPSDKFKKRLALRRSLQNSGYARDGDFFWVAAYGPLPFREVMTTKGRKVGLTEKILIKLSADGQALGYYRHPLLNTHRGRHKMLGMHSKSLLFYTIEEGNSVVQIPVSDLVNLKP